MRRIAMLLAVLALTACGGAKQSATSTRRPDPPAEGRTLYAGGDWVVNVRAGAASVYRFDGGRWRRDTSGGVKIRILGPERETRAARVPQVAVELSARQPLVESGIWLDGSPLAVKGGGLTPTRGTIYGAPAAPLAKGEHTAVAYGRTRGSGAAVAWTFRV